VFEVSVGRKAACGPKHEKTPPCFSSTAACACATHAADDVRNEKVIAYDEIVHPAETESGEGFPSLTVFLGDGVLQLTPDEGSW